MLDTLSAALPAVGFLPHGQCFLWFQDLLLLHVVSDSLITLAYYSIPLALVYFVRRRRDVEMRGLVVMFASFILACGTTHALGVWTIWEPDYWLSGMVKALTALVSVSTAIAVWFLMPKALALPSPSQLQQANDNLRREMNERRQTLTVLQETEERFRSAFDYAPIGMALVSPQGRWLRVNRSLCELLGYGEQELLNMDFQRITHPEDLDSDLRLLQETLEGRRRSYQLEKRYLHKDGRIIWILLAASLVRDEQNRPLYFVAQIQDITERRQIQQELERRVEERTRALARANADLEESNRQLERLARYDELTGLYNRRHLMECLDQALSTARRYRTPFCVIMLDADHFKRINDTYGHTTGDRVLTVLGRLIRDNLRSSDVAGRYGGEEFCIALPMSELSDARQVAEKLRARIEREAMEDDESQPLRITASLGLAAWQPGIDDVGILLDRADQALYTAKSEGRNRVVVADPSAAGSN